jgi:hypothetical protein|tara:strand:+ start:3726 stop:4190 length:465 start_codon:yes stop_codon:yes gene_type:complete
VENSRVIGSRAGSTVSSIKLEGHHEVLSDERVIVVASKAVDIPHHTRRAMEDLKEITEKFLSPSTNLMDGSIIFEDFLDGAAVAEPKELSTPEKFPVLTDGPATATSFSDEGMIVALTLGTAARAESNRTEASAAHCNVEVANAVRSEEGECGC